MQAVVTPHVLSLPAAKVLMKPAVSIVIPMHNDADWVEASLTSCARQSLRDIEVICVDDASTDATPDIVNRFVARDSRFRLIQEETNASAFHARRLGVEAASAPFVMFLDGDDELSPDAAKLAVSRAQEAQADVVGFGVSIVADDGNVPRRFENALQPRYDELFGADIITSLFPVGEEANGHLWRYLFGAHLLRSAYAEIPVGAQYFRANDLPITFLALAHATKYVSLPDRLYNYNFRRGTSGHAIDGIEHFAFLLSGVDPVTSIEPLVRSVSGNTSAPAAIIDAYESARLHIIGNVLRYCVRDTAGDLQRQCIALLVERVGALQAIRAAAQFCTSALPALADFATVPTSLRQPVKNVLLTTAHLDTGGLQSVLVDQASALVSAGYAVTIAVMRSSTDGVPVPEGVEVVYLGDGLLSRLDHWVSICKSRSVDVIIDHHLLYNERWPWFVLAALAVDVPTIGWLHNFALRPIFDRSQRASFLTAYLPLLQTTVTLSPTDVAFWKLQGLERVVYLPNPASALTRWGMHEGRERELPSGRWELAWWGRLDGPTKQVRHLVDLASALEKAGVDFRLRIIGPESKNLRARDLRRQISRHDLHDFVELVPSLAPDELAGVLEDTDLMVSTSAIEGYQLTILEAQAFGIPVVMYDLPWLSTVRGNDGLVAIADTEPMAMASAISELSRDPARYARLSRRGREFVRASLSVDVSVLLRELLSGKLDVKYSPEPTIEDAQILTRWMVRYSERNIRHYERENRRKSGEDEGPLSRIEKRLRRAEGELDAIKRGPSFRVGRSLTFVPRAIRKWISARR